MKYILISSLILCSFLTIYSQVKVKHWEAGYPPVAIALNKTGQVTVQVRITPTGKVDSSYTYCEPTFNEATNNRLTEEDLLCRATKQYVNKWVYVTGFERLRPCIAGSINCRSKYWRYNTVSFVYKVKYSKHRDLSQYNGGFKFTKVKLKKDDPARGFYTVYLTGYSTDFGVK